MKIVPTALAVASLAAAGVLAVSATPAAAAHGGGGVTKTGSCTATSVWKVKVKADDTGLEVQGEVDSNVVGQTWRWTIADNGVRVAKGTASTAAPSGSFSVTRILTDQAGRDAVVFKAVNPANGEVCRGAVAL